MHKLWCSVSVFHPKLPSGCFSIKFADVLIYCVNTWPLLCTGFYILLYFLCIMNWSSVLLIFFMVKPFAYNLWSLFLLIVLFLFLLGK